MSNKMLYLCHGLKCYDFLISQTQFFEKFDKGHKKNYF